MPIFIWLVKGKGKYLLTANLEYYDKVSTNQTYLGHEFRTSMDNSKVNGVSRRKSKQKRKQSQISLFFSVCNSQQGTNTLKRYLYFRTYATLELTIFRTVPNRFMYFVTKIVLTYCLKFKAEGRESSKNLRSLEQFIQTVQ